MLNVKAVVEEAQVEGTLETEVSPMEALSLRVMGVLSQHKALFKMVTTSNPEDAYTKAGEALRMFLTFSTVEAHHNEAKTVLAELRCIEKSFGKDSVDRLDKAKAMMSKNLWEAGRFIVNTGAFGADTASILGLFTARMAAHTVKEGKWAGKEIKKSFIRRFF